MAVGRHDSTTRRIRTTTGVAPLTTNGLSSTTCAAAREPTPHHPFDSGRRCLLFPALMLATLIYGQAFADETAREGDGIIYIPVLRVGPSDGEASVRYATCPAAATNTAATTACGTLEGTATPGTDYTVATGIVEFADGETSERIGVTLIDDSIDEENETLHFVLYDPTGLEITEESVVTVGTITDDDPAPRLNADSPSVGEDAGSMVFTAMLDRASARSLAVPWETADRTATAGEDYTPQQRHAFVRPGRHEQNPVHTHNRRRHRGSARNPGGRVQEDRTCDDRRRRHRHHRGQRRERWATVAPGQGRGGQRVRGQSPVHPSR